jgi:ABC-type bacteriocin/lantibiotic exporter with double-glycine peptidase domain
MQNEDGQSGFLNSFIVHHSSFETKFMIALLTKRFRKRTKVSRLIPSVETEEGEARYKPIDMTMVRRLFAQLMPFKKQYALGLVLGAAQVLLEMQGPRFTKWVLNLTTGFARHEPGAPATSGKAISLLFWIIILWSVTLLAAVILQRFTILVMTRAGESVQFSIRRRLFAKLQQLSMSYYDKPVHE